MSGRSFTHNETNFGTIEDRSGTSGTHYDTNFESLHDDTGLGPEVGVVPTMALTLGRLRTSLGPVVHTLRLTLS